MPHSLEHRSDKTELIDGPFVQRELLHRNLHELDILNRLAGGHAGTVGGIRRLVTEKSRTYHIVDLGCGSGDTLKHIAVWARAFGYKVRLTGVDRNRDAIDYLKEKCRDYPEITGTVNDYHDFISSSAKIDVVVCSLFCHHLSDTELLALFGDMKRSVREGFIISDLHRNWIAYYGVKYLTRMMNGSLLSRVDGPVSVLRAFTSKELRSLLRNAHVTRYSVRWKWPFRYLVIARTSPPPDAAVP
jgi:SAM-dependent methyltransferase